MSPTRIPASWMRGGSRRGLFFHAVDLPSTRRARDALLLRIFGGPDSGGQCLDGLGTAGDAAGRIAVVSRSQRPGTDVDVLFGEVSADASRIEWNAGCSHLVAAVGPFAIDEGLFPATDGPTRVRLRVVNDDMRIDAFVPVRQGRSVEGGAFGGDGLPFTGSEIRLEFLEPCADPFPGGLLRDRLALPGEEPVEVTCVSVGEPTVFVRADAIGLTGRESAGDLERRRRVLERVIALRSVSVERYAAAGGAARLRLAWVGKPAAYRAGGGADVPADAIDLLVRSVDGRGAGHDVAGADALAVAVAAAVPGTVVAEVARTLPGVPTRIGLAAGTVAVGADVVAPPPGGGAWRVERCVLSRSARRLMSGLVHLPAPA